MSYTWSSICFFTLEHEFRCRLQLEEPHSLYTLPTEQYHDPGCLQGHTAVVCLAATFHVDRFMGKQFYTYGGTIVHSTNKQHTDDSLFWCRLRVTIVVVGILQDLLKGGWIPKPHPGPPCSLASCGFGMNDWCVMSYDPTYTKTSHSHMPSSWRSTQMNHTVIKRSVLKIVVNLNNLKQRGFQGIYWVRHNSPTDATSIHSRSSR